MRANLVQIDGPGAARRTRLGLEPLVIGRDEDADLCVPNDRVSRRHALIEPCDQGYTLRDLGSRNGTTVNDEPAVGEVTLRPGDQISLADVATFEFEVGRGRAGAVGGALLALVLMGAIAFFWGPIQAWLWPDRALEHATLIAKDAIASSRQGDLTAARRGLQQAAGVLYQDDRLDGLERGQLMPKAFKLIEGALDQPVDLAAILRRAIESQVKEIAKLEVEPPPATKGAATEDCKLDRVPADELDPCIQYWLRKVLIDLRQDPNETPPGFHKVVAARILKEREFLKRSIGRGEEFVPMLSAELEIAKMPGILHYVSLIESGYIPKAGSTAGAAGLWQFMPATAKNYGLAVRKDLDERHDPRKSTQAAAQYLRALAFEFGGNAMLLALASYNKGENGVRRALKQLDDPFSDRSYWRLVEKKLIPQETADYVPRFLAAAVAGEGGLPSAEALAKAGYRSS
jgi:hypothetical protein